MPFHHIIDRIVPVALVMLAFIAGGGTALVRL